jgi:ABC-type lipoprotein release transport system permease subunit
MVYVLETFIQPFDVSVSPLLLLITLLFAIMVSFVASVGPALSASHVRISETLHYE